ncbi:hypothetical protein ACF0H5_013331 [Mactra antiquata]
MGLQEDDIQAYDVVGETSQDDRAVGFAYSDGYQPVPDSKLEDIDQMNVTVCDDEENEFSQKPNSHFTAAICVSLFCFLPTGLIALIYSRKTDQLIKEDKIKHAKMMAEKSRNWIIYSVMAFCVCLCIATVCRIFTVMFSPDLYPK